MAVNACHGYRAGKLTSFETPRRVPGLSAPILLTCYPIKPELSEKIAECQRQKATR
jgi:hypothetical protein